ncbi:MAG: head GIN domain-containing protein [Gammaproteobacteria bacterium]
MIMKTGLQSGNRRSTKQRFLAAVGLGLVVTVSNVSAGQAVTGKIVIDGVIYGEGSPQYSKGSGDFGRESRQVEAFRSVKVLGGVDIHYRRNTAQRVEISGDRNLLPLIKTQVSQGVLTIGSEKSYQTQLPLTVELNGPVLTGLAMRGAGDIVLNDLNEESLRLELSGSGDVKADGRVKHLSVSLTGSSDVDAKNVDSEQADVKLTGSGDLAVTVRDSLRVQILGSGDVTYYGNPRTIDKRIIGSGDIQSGD